MDFPTRPKRPWKEAIWLSVIDAGKLGAVAVALAALWEIVRLLDQYILSWRNLGYGAAVFLVAAIIALPFVLRHHRRN